MTPSVTAHPNQDTGIRWIRNGNGSTLYFLIPGELHQLQPHEQEEGYLISFPENLVNSSSEDLELVYRFNLFHLLTRSPGIQLSLQSRNVKLVKNFVELLENNYKSWKLVKNYAGELSVTANHLNEVVKKISGFSAGYHIRQRVVLEAKRRAVYSNDSMKQIAYWLGFGDSAHFSKFFKGVCGKNFSDFKKERYSPIS